MEGEIKSVTVFTDGSAVPNPGVAGYGFYAIDNCGNEYNGYGPVGLTATNNAAELSAVIQVLDYFHSLKIKNISLHSDSRYVLDGIGYVDGWARKDWVTSSGQAVKNIPLWKTLKQRLEDYRKEGVITFTWVKGHNGTHGNERADNNATAGRLALSQGKDVHFTEVISPKPPKEEVPVDEPVVKVKSEKIIPINPLLLGKKWFFNTNQITKTGDGRFIYTICHYRDDKELHNKNLAKPSPDTSYSIALLNNPVPELDSLRERFTQAFKQLIIPVVGELSKITSGKIWPTIVADQNVSLKIKGNLGVNADSTVLAEVLSPPRLAYKIEELMLYGFTMISDYETSNPRTLSVNITDAILDTGKKGKQTIKSDFAIGPKLLLIKDIEIKEGGPKTTVKLVPGTDTLLRNTLSALLKVSKTPITLTLLLTDIVVNDNTISSYKVATIVSYDGGSAIYYAPHANYRILTQE